jgi:YfiH family protein
MFIYKENGGVGYYYSTLLHSLHAFSTRKGGVSRLTETAGLNLAFGRGDDEKTVLANLQCFAKAVGFKAEHVISLPQVHGNEVLHVTPADAGRGYFKPALGEGDGYMTEHAGIVLGVKSADCVPVLLEARDAGGCVLAVAAVHAGWRGTAGGIAVQAVEALRAQCVTKAEVFAAIGPCIGQCCFEVGRDCVDIFEQNLGTDLVRACFTQAASGKYYGDLVRVSRMLLNSAGVPDAQIDAAELCTCCRAEQFFSHRYASGNTEGKRGTMLSVICK